MAYQPKFGAPRNQNQGRSVPQRGGAPEERRAASAGSERNNPARASSVSTQERSPRPSSVRRSASPPPQEKKKPSKGVVALFVVLGIFLIPLSLKFSADLLIFVYTSVGRPGVAARTTTANMNLGGSFASQTGQWERELRAVLGGTVTVPGETVSEETVPQETVPQETVPRVRKEYPIADDALVAPKPDQSKFGESADPSVLQVVLDEAAWLLDGQRTYFDPNMELAPDTTVKFYLDDSIFAITWNQVFDDCVYTFSEVKISHPSQFRIHLADGIYGSESKYTTTQMSETVNAVVAAGAYFYKQRTFGAMVYQGEAKKTDGKYSQTCFIDRNGDMKFVRAGVLKDSRDTQKYVDENDIWFSICFGPILVEDYQLETTDTYGVGEITNHYNRAALCQMDKLHYLVAVACQQGDGKLYNKPPTVAEFGKRIYETGCRHAYSLDGGQTASIAMNNELMNRPTYGQQRLISDIIFFATGIEEGG